VRERHEPVEKAFGGPGGGEFDERRACQVRRPGDVESRPGSRAMVDITHVHGGGVVA
jgi:hypothetical protein